MSVASEIAQMQANLNDSYSAIETLGGTLPDNQNFDNLSSTISRLSTLYVGQYVKSALPITSAGLHLLDGGIIQGNGIYKEFVDYIAGLYGDGTNIPNYFTDETTWQNSVSTYGTCGKFVYDSVNNTVRLPKITGFIEGTTDPTALGDLVEAGCPNITGSVSTLFSGSARSSQGSLSYSNLSSAAWVGSNSSTVNSTINFDASQSSSIYGNSDTVQPQSIKALYYIVIATSTKTDIQVDIDEIATDLNEKVDKADLQEVYCVVETYVNGTEYYRIWSDGWIEQGGYKEVGDDANVTVNLLKTFSNTNYKVLFGNRSSAYTASTFGLPTCLSKTASSFNIGGQSNGGRCDTDWYACGY